MPARSLIMCESDMRERLRGLLGLFLPSRDFDPFKGDFGALNFGNFSKLTPKAFNSLYV